MHLTVDTGDAAGACYDVISVHGGARVVRRQFWLVLALISVNPLTRLMFLRPRPGIVLELKL